jgi:hypothetical protein
VEKRQKTFTVKEPKAPADYVRALTAYRNKQQKKNPNFGRRSVTPPPKKLLLRCVPLVVSILSLIALIIIMICLKWSK